MKCIITNDSVGLAIYERTLTVQKAIQAPNVLMQISEYGEVNVLRAVTALLISTAEYFNFSGNLKPEQATQIAALFLSEYIQESLEDLALMLKKLKLGSYGTIYRIDGDTIFKCLNLYLAEKSEEFEKIKQNEKVQANNETMEAYIEFAADVLSRKEEKDKEPKKHIPAILTEKGHFEAFKKLVTEFNDRELSDLLNYYRSINTPVGSEIITGQPITKGHLDHYIEVIKKEAEKRINDKKQK